MMLIGDMDLTNICHDHISYDYFIYNLAWFGLINFKTEFESIKFPDICSIYGTFSNSLTSL